MQLNSITIYKKGSDFLPCIADDTIVVAGNQSGRTFPIAYVHKPKGINASDWAEIKEKIEIHLME